MIDLRTNTRESGTWIRKFGDHEEVRHIHISIGSNSVMITYTDLHLEIMVDRGAVPAVETLVVDVDRLKEQIGAAFVKHVSPTVFLGVLSEIAHQRSMAYHDGKMQARSQSRELFTQFIASLGID